MICNMGGLIDYSSNLPEPVASSWCYNFGLDAYDHGNEQFGIQKGRS